MKFNVDRLSKTYITYTKEKAREVLAMRRREGHMGGILITAFILWLATRDE